MAKRIDVSDLNIYYGSFRAVEGVSFSSSPGRSRRSSARPAAASPPFLRTLNRMHEVIAGARVEGKVALDGEDIYGAGRRPGATSAARSAWSSSGPTRSRRCPSTTTSSPGCGCTAG